MADSEVNLRQQVSDRKRLERAYVRLQNREGTDDLLAADKPGAGVKAVTTGAALAATAPVALGTMTALPELITYRGDRGRQLTLEKSMEIGKGSPLDARDSTLLHNLLGQTSSPNKEIREKSRSNVLELLETAKRRGVNVDVPTHELRQVLKNSMGGSLKAAIPIGILGAVAGFARYRNKKKKKESLIREALHKSAELKMPLSSKTVEYFWKEVDAIHAAESVKVASLPPGLRSFPRDKAASVPAFLDEVEKIAEAEKTAIFGFLKNLFSGGGKKAVSEASRSAAKSRLSMPQPSLRPAQLNLGNSKGRGRAVLGQTPAPAASTSTPSNSLNTPAAEALRQKAGGAAAIQKRLRERAGAEAVNPGGRVDFGNKEGYGTFSAGRS